MRHHHEFTGRSERAERRGRGPGGRGFGRGPGGGRPGDEPGFDGFGPFGGPFGPQFGPGGGRGPGRRGGRGRRGEVRRAILAVLREGPANGYQMMETIAERSQGVWRPSPGSVYPALNLLEDEGLIRSTEVDGKKAFELSESGREHVASIAEELDATWQEVAGPHEGFLDVRQEVMQLAMTLKQVAQQCDPQQRDQAKAVLVRARRDLHRIMAGDPVQAD